MNNVNTNTSLRLPLSWAQTNTAEPLLNFVSLPYSSPGWIPTAEIPNNYPFEQIYQEYLSSFPNGFVLQSCNPPLRDFLIQHGCQAAAMGAEAVIDLPWRGKRSVRELARRGRRHGTVREIEQNAKNQHQLVKLLQSSPSRQGVQLQHIERSVFDDATRCFIFEMPEKRWMGAITLSCPAPGYVHTELILRHQKAPVGIMEAIITAVMRQLALEGVQHLSLGTVTPLPAAESEMIFAAHRHPKELWVRSRLFFRLGRALKFVYNAEDLWRFKNKFSPRWEPLYLCASPGLSLATIVGLIQATGYLALIRSKFLNVIPVSIPAVRPPFLPINNDFLCRM